MADRIRERAYRRAEEENRRFIRRCQEFLAAFIQRNTGPDGKFSPSACSRFQEELDAFWQAELNPAETRDAFLEEVQKTYETCMRQVN